MRVRMKHNKRAAGPERGYVPSGGEIDLPDDVGQEWIDSGAAELVVPAVVESKADAAKAPAKERAVKAVRETR